jgi:hypothetical protein
MEHGGNISVVVKRQYYHYRIIIIPVMRSKELKTGSNLAESSKEGYGSKGAVLQIIIIIIIIGYQHYRFKSRLLINLKI